jgi:glycine dehydrogenase subunit 1
MFPYIPNTDKDERAMLDVIGVETLDDLFKDIPEKLLLDRALDIGEPMSELEVQKALKELAGMNKSAETHINFLGAGAYDHYIPSVVAHMAGRSEFYTAYTPYQPEISQGTLQVIFEYQTMIADLTGMDVSNASLYDGASAIAEAAMVACAVSKKNRILVSETVHPHTREVLATYTHFKGIEVETIPEKNGVTDLDKLSEMVDEETAGVILQNPNFFGNLEELKNVKSMFVNKKTNFILSVDAISLGLFKKPSEYGVDIVAGEGQAFGNTLNFGGPYLGFMGTTKKNMRKMPGRVVGQTVDVDGKRAFVLTLQAREQHIRREKATSNICSNQALNALIATVYLITMGKEGLREAATQSAQKAHYAYEKICKLDRFEAAFDKPFFKEFAIKTDIDPLVVSKTLLDAGIMGGYDLGKSYPGYKNTLLFAVTEKRTKAEIDKLVEALEGIK